MCSEIRFPLYLFLWVFFSSFPSQIGLQTETIKTNTVGTITEGLSNSVHGPCICRIRKVRNQNYGQKKKSYFHFLCFQKAVIFKRITYMKYYNSLSFNEKKLSISQKLEYFYVCYLNCQDTEALIYMYMNYLS